MQSITTERETLQKILVPVEFKVGILAAAIDTKTLGTAGSQNPLLFCYFNAVF